MLFRLVPALGLTQIISWGALYYSIAVLGASIRDELGLSAAALFGAYSLSLLLSALTAPLAGRAIDRYGGRLVMSVGSVTAALALVAIAHAHSAIALYAAWALAGIAMAMTLYDAAFATLSQHAGTSYRSALTALTLMGGLASTASLPAARQAAFAIVAPVTKPPAVPGGRPSSSATQRSATALSAAAAGDITVRAAF